jgi:replicative DNA helicase
MKLTEILRARYEGIKEERRRIKQGLPPSSFIPTRLREFDKRGGHKRKEISLYGAETGGGKSLWKLHLAWAAASTGHTVTIVDLEDPVDRTADRGFAKETGINSARILTGQDLTDKEVQQIGLALQGMEEWADRIEVFEGVRTGDEALELFKEYRADMEMLDYLSAFPHGKHGRERSISDFMWGWTKHVQEEEVAGIAFAQLKGDVTERGLEAAKWIQARAERNGKEVDVKRLLQKFRGFDTGDLMWCTDAGRNAKCTRFMIRPGRILKKLGLKAVDNVIEFDAPKINWSAEQRIRVGIDLKTARFTDLDEKE